MEDITNMEPGEVVAMMRQNQNMRQKELKNKLGISQTFMSKLEHGKRNLTLKLFLRIIKLLGYKLYIKKP